MSLELYNEKIVEIMNLRKKAWESERRCQLELEAQGWITEKMQYSGRQFQKRKDFFGLWDIIALRNNEIKFIQVKTNHKPVLDLFRVFKVNHQIENSSFEIWIWYEEGISAKYSREWRKIIL